MVFAVLALQRFAGVTSDAVGYLALDTFGLRYFLHLILWTGGATKRRVRTE